MNMRFRTQNMQDAEQAIKDCAYIERLKSELADVAGISGDQSIRPGRLADSIKALSDLFQDDMEITSGVHIGSLLWLLADEARAIELRIMIEAQERHMRDSQMQAAPC